MCSISTSCSPSMTRYRRARLDARDSLVGASPVEASAARRRPRDEASTAALAAPHRFASSACARAGGHLAHGVRGTEQGAEPLQHWRRLRRKRRNDARPLRRRVLSKTRRRRALASR
mmetsp:Transcript_36570/g.113132  ORF Transcript_36570/g.113132 Transcript_36570/m.113132 type:complete len:117 (+) Transcript_36570:729-1079(+)